MTCATPNISQSHYAVFYRHQGYVEKKALSESGENLSVSSSSFLALSDPGRMRSAGDGVSL